MLRAINSSRMPMTALGRGGSVFFFWGCSPRPPDDPVTDDLFKMMGLEDKDEDGLIERDHHFWEPDEGYDGWDPVWMSDGYHCADINRDESLDADEIFLFMYSRTTLDAYRFASDHVKEGYAEGIKLRYLSLVDRFACKEGHKGPWVSTLAKDLLSLALYTKDAEFSDLAIRLSSEARVHLTIEADDLEKACDTTDIKFFDSMLRLASSSEFDPEGTTGWWSSCVDSLYSDKHSAFGRARMLYLGKILADGEQPDDMRHMALRHMDALYVLRASRLLGPDDKACRKWLDEALPAKLDPYVWKTAAEEMDRGFIGHEFALAIMDLRRDDAGLCLAEAVLGSSKWDWYLLPADKKDGRFAKASLNSIIDLISSIDEEESKYFSPSGSLDYMIYFLKQVSPKGEEASELAQFVLDHDEISPVVRAGILVRLGLNGGLRDLAKDATKNKEGEAALLLRAIHDLTCSSDPDFAAAQTRALIKMIAPLILGKNDFALEDIIDVIEHDTADQLLIASSKNEGSDGPAHHYPAAIEVPTTYGPVSSGRKFKGLYIVFDHTYSAYTDFEFAKMELKYGNSVKKFRFKHSGTGAVFLPATKAADELKVEVWQGDHNASASIKHVSYVYM